MAPVSLTIRSCLTAAACAGIAFDLKNLTIVKAVRLVQLLRPLRTISRLHGLRLVVTSLLSSVSPIPNVMFLGILLFAYTAVSVITDRSRLQRPNCHPKLESAKQFEPQHRALIDVCNARLLG